MQSMHQTMVQGHASLCTNLQNFSYSNWTIEAVFLALDLICATISHMHSDVLDAFPTSKQIHCLAKDVEFCCKHTHIAADTVYI